MGDSSPAPTQWPAAFGMVFATPEEAGPFKACLSAWLGDVGIPVPHASRNVVREVSLPGGGKIAWTISGIGSDSAFRAAKQLAQRHGVDWLVSVGVSGALRLGLAPGDVVRVGLVIDEAGQRWPASALPGSPGGPELLTTFCASQVIRSPFEKKVLSDKWDALLVDMETAGVARAAQDAGVGFSVVRAISDGLRDSIPIDIMPFLNSEGHIRYPRLILAIMARPRAIPGLAQLGARTRRASCALASYLISTLRQPGGALP